MKKKKKQNILIKKTKVTADIHVEQRNIEKEKREQHKTLRITKV